MSVVVTKYTIEEAKQRLEQLYDYDKSIFHEAVIRSDLNTVAYICHLVAVSRGWWHEQRWYNSDVQMSAYYFVPKLRNFAEMIALIHSELSEALEGFRSSKPSDHIEGYTMFEEEMGDTLIRMGDLAYALNARFMEATFAKLAFNMVREDHSLERREAEGGKKF